MKREPHDMNEMTPEQIAAFRFCMGADTKLSKWHCRRHFLPRLRPIRPPGRFQAACQTTGNPLDSRPLEPIVHVRDTRFPARPAGCEGAGVLEETR